MEIMGKKIIIGIILLCSCVQTVKASNDNAVKADTIVTNSFWDNWYGQVGFDMSLMNPYGSNFIKNVFPNGKSYGLDVALGKWFTPEVGVRGKFNWENGILRSDHAKWIPEEYITLTADVQLNLHNLLGDYNSDRKWNLSVYPRLGALIRLEDGEGSPLLGLGVNNTYRLNNTFSLYGDVSYQVCSNVLGFATGIGTGSNGFFAINLGVQVDIGNNKFEKITNTPLRFKHAVATNSFWDNWFVQAGLGMSLFNLYGSNFSNVIPNGKTFGINLGIGKWFSPEMGIRGGVNWQNGIFGNDHLTWLDETGKPGSNHKGGGYGAVYMDVLFNLHHIILGYEESRMWNSLIYPRAGIASNFDLGGGSPLIGFGTEQTFKLDDRWKLYVDLGYQFTTSELVTEENNTNLGGSPGSSNGWFDFNVGVQYEIGKYWWDKPNEVHGSRLRVNDGHNWPRFIVNTIGSVGVAYVGKTALKAMIKEERPDHSDNKSFPSGHAAIAFAAARSIDKEFRKDCIWIPIAGYAAATAIGIERVASDRHHWYDVAAGAALGFGSAELTWWLSDIIFKKHNEKYAVGFSGNTVDVAINL